VRSLDGAVRLLPYNGACESVGGAPYPSAYSSASSNVPARRDRSGSAQSTVRGARSPVPHTIVAAPPAGEGGNQSGGIELCGSLVGTAKFGGTYRYDRAISFTAICTPALSSTATAVVRPGLRSALELQHLCSQFPAMQRADSKWPHSTSAGTHRVLPERLCLALVL
jgi:hypothetical protein